MRDTEKVSQLFGIIEPEKMRESSHHEHFKGDEVAFAKLGHPRKAGHPCATTASGF
jgi:hypothetical protein